MYPDSPFAHPRGSFLGPVPVPSGDPDGTPTFTVAISCLWLPYIRGALQQLLLQSTWNTDDPNVLLLVQQRAFTLISMFEECESGGFPFDCRSQFSVTQGKQGWDILTDNVGDLAHPYGFYDTLLGGFHGTTCYETGGNDYWTFVAIAQTFGSSASFDSIGVSYNMFIGDNFGGNFIANNNTTIQIYSGASLVAMKTFPQSDLITGEDLFLFWNAEHAIGDKIVITLLAGVSGASPSAGSVQINGLEISGVGIDTPFACGM